MLDRTMIMAAGLGTRMRSMNLNLPKPLVPVLGRPLVDRSIDCAVAAGSRRVVVNAHYLGDMLIEHLSQRSDVEVVVSDERSQLMGTGGALAKAREHLGPDPFFVLNSDSLWIGDHPLKELKAAFDPARMDLVLNLIPIESSKGYDRKGDFFLNESGQLTRPQHGQPAPFVFTGAYIVSPHLLNDAPEGPFSANLIFDRVMAAGRAFGVVHRGGWVDAGHPDGITLAEELLKTT